METVRRYQVIEVIPRKPRAVVVVRELEAAPARELHKTLSNFERLEEHLTATLDHNGKALILPTLPDSLDGDVDALVERLDAFIAFVEAHAASDAETLQFFASSLPLPKVWGNVGSDASVCAPKVRRVEVDVEIVLVSGLSEGVDSVSVVLVCEDQRYTTRPKKSNSAGEAVWVETATLQAPSTAAWFTAVALRDDKPIGVVRVPVLPYFGREEKQYEEYALLAMPSGEATNFRLALQIRTVRAGTRDSQRGLAARALPIRLDTGDVVLMRMKTVSGWFNRLVTWSEWDHAALVVGGRTPTLLEVTSDDGVVRPELEAALERYKSASSELAVRRLRMERTPEMHQAASDFAQEVRGRPYNWNVISMATTSSPDLSAANDSSLPQSMFCSELVAAGLRRLGVLPSDSVPDNYLPGTLSNLNLNLLVMSDPLVKFRFWDGDLRAPERQWVEQAVEQSSLWSMPATRVRMTQTWKSMQKESIVTVVGALDDGFLLLDEASGGGQVPSAFVCSAKP